MRKEQLADELRRRQHAFGGVERELIDALPDDAIIDCYLTCSCCGKRQIGGPALDTAIERAVDAEHFFRLCDAMVGPPHARRPAREG